MYLTEADKNVIRHKYKRGIGKLTLMSTYGLKTTEINEILNIEDDAEEKVSSSKCRHPRSDCFAHNMVNDECTILVDTLFIHKNGEEYPCPFYKRRQDE